MNPLYSSFSPSSTAATTAAATAAFSVGDPFSVWDFSTIEDLEAQKFLEETIAQNNRYRYEDSKRKLELLDDFDIQIPTKANHSLSVASVPHTDLSSQADISDTSISAAEPQKKKPGRKPLTNTPSSKRKAQNRAAQRAFRERKERYVKELETKIKELESQTAKSDHENQRLKGLVDKLQTENFILKQSSGGGGGGGEFAFNFTPDKPNQFTLDVDKNITELVLPNQTPSSLADTNPSASPSSYDSVSDDEAASPTAQTSPDSNSSATLSLFGLELQKPQLPTQKILPPAKSAKPQNAQEFCKKFTNGMCPDDVSDDDDEPTNNVVKSSKRGSLTSSGAFTQYRDPSPFTANIDNSESAPIPPLFEESFEDFGSYMPLVTPSAERPNPLPGDFNTIEEIRDKKYLSCNKVWERLHKHPKYEDIGADEVDQLCIELKSKAKCSGTGPVVPEDEVDAVLVKLEEKEK